MPVLWGGSMFPNALGGICSETLFSSLRFIASSTPPTHTPTPSMPQLSCRGEKQDCTISPPTHPLTLLCPQLSCGGEKQERILAAAAAAAADGADNGKRGGGGGGVMLLSIAGSSHNTFADALPLFGQKTGWLLGEWVAGLPARCGTCMPRCLSCAAGAPCSQQRRLRRF